MTSYSSDSCRQTRIPKPEAGRRSAAPAGSSHSKLHKLCVSDCCSCVSCHCCRWSVVSSTRTSFTGCCSLAVSLLLSGVASDGNRCCWLCFCECLWWLLNAAPLLYLTSSADLVLDAPDVDSEAAGTCPERLGARLASSSAHCPALSSAVALCPSRRQSLLGLSSLLPLAVLRLRLQPVVRSAAIVLSPSPSPSRSCVLSPSRVQSV